MIRPTIGLLLGDRNGIGPEIATKLLADAVLAADASLVAIGDPAVLAYGCKVSGAQLPDDLRFINRTNCAYEPIGSSKVSAAAGAEVLDHLAFALTRSGPARSTASYSRRSTNRQCGSVVWPRHRQARWDEGGCATLRSDGAQPSRSPVNAEDLPVVDAHQHFWDLERNYHPWLCDAAPSAFRYGDYSAIRRSYLPADYLRDAGRTRVALTVHVEAEWDPRNPVGETHWLEELAAASAFPSACVAQAWLDREDVAAVLAAQAARPLVRGIRHKPHAAASPQLARRGVPGSMDDERWRRGFALLEQHTLSFDLQTPWWHFDAAAELARDFPNTPIIINHTGLPADRSPAGLRSWRAAMHVVAQRPNVFLKISGLGQPCVPWTVAANRPIIRDAISIFGAGRCMFASNYPVDRLCAPFETIFAGFRDAVWDLSQVDQRKLFYDNAVQIYRL